MWLFLSRRENGPRLDCILEIRCFFTTSRRLPELLEMRNCYQLQYFGVVLAGPGETRSRAWQRSPQNTSREFVEQQIELSGEWSASEPSDKGHCWLMLLAASHGAWSGTGRTSDQSPATRCRPICRWKRAFGLSLAVATTQ